MKHIRSTVFGILATALLSAGFDGAVDMLQSALGFAPRAAEGLMLAQPNGGKNVRRPKRHCPPDAPATAPRIEAV